VQEIAFRDADLAQEDVFLSLYPTQGHASELIEPLTRILCVDLRPLHLIRPCRRDATHHAFEQVLLAAKVPEYGGLGPTESLDDSVRVRPLVTRLHEFRLSSIQDPPFDHIGRATDDGLTAPRL
jgi:hypothetical protein